MQNTANQYIRLAIQILLSALGYLFVFGNKPANGLVTELLQYPIHFCNFRNWQNIENHLTLNRLT